MATDYHEKQLQRALLQYNRPQSADLVREALMLCGREDLIGHGKHCLVKPAGKPAAGRGEAPRGPKTDGRSKSRDGRGAKSAAKGGRDRWDSAPAKGQQGRGNTRSPASGSKPGRDKKKK